MGKQWKQWQILFSCVPKSLQMVTTDMVLKDACFLEGKLWQPRQHIKEQRRHFVNKGLYSQSYGFSSSHVWMWVLDHKEDWVPKKYTFKLWHWRRLENFLDCREIKPINHKGNQALIFIGRTGAKAEAPILWPPDVKNWLIGKDTVKLGKIEGRRRRGRRRMRWIDSTDSMHMNLNKLQETGGQRRLAAYSSWSGRVGHVIVTEQQQHRYKEFL